MAISNSLQDTTSEAFFEKKYKDNPDPWRFASSEYELSRYDAVANALAGRHYRRAFEPGCSIGILTSRLAEFCDAVYAIDISPTAVQQARQRCRELPNALIECGALPGAIPSGNFDLIVLSEIGYYLQEEQLMQLSQQLINRINPAGTLLAAHWLGTSEDHILSGDRVHEILATLPGVTHDLSERREGFRLDRWTIS